MGRLTRAPGWLCSDCAQAQQPGQKGWAMIPAYIDPGAGSLAVQALVAGLVALPVLFRRQMAKVGRLLRREHDGD